MSSQDSNVVENRPLPLKPTGSLAVAAFQKGKSTPSKESKPSKRRTSSSSAQPPPKKPPQDEPSSPSPAKGAAKKRKRASQPAPASSDDDGDVSSPAPASPAPAPRSLIDAAVSDGFAPARFASVDAAGLLTGGSASAPPPPLVLFQFPAKFDVAAFTALGSLSLPMQAPVGEGVGVVGRGPTSKVVSHFELHGERYSLIEGDTSELSDLINLFPLKGRGALTPGRPFARLLRVVGDVAVASDALSHTWPHSGEAVVKKTPKEPKQGLRPHFRPVGYIRDFKDHLVGSRRGRHFRPVEAVEEKSGSPTLKAQGKAGKSGRQVASSPVVGAASKAVDAAEKREKKRQRKEEEPRKSQGGGAQQPRETAVAPSDVDKAAAQRKGEKAAKKDRKRMSQGS